LEAFSKDFEIFDPLNFFPVTRFLVTSLLCFWEVSTGKTGLPFQGAFSIYKNFRKISLGNFLLERVRSICHKFHSIEEVEGRLKDRERHGTGDKSNEDEKSVNGTQIFHWEVSTGKTGLPF